jgi:hypothetical protein
MKRWHEDWAVTLGQWWLHARIGHEGQATGCPCDRQVGRFRKRRGLGCGRARCQLCHFEKIHGVKTHAERTADARFLEQLEGNG